MVGILSQNEAHFVPVVFLLITFLKVVQKIASSNPPMSPVVLSPFIRVQALLLSIEVGRLSLFFFPLCDH